MANCRLEAVGAQADFPAQLQAVDLAGEVLVVGGIEIQGADDVPLGAVVGVPVHHRVQPAPEGHAVPQVDGVFFLLAGDFIHPKNTPSFFQKVP